MARPATRSARTKPQHLRLVKPETLLSITSHDVKVMLVEQTILKDVAAAMAPIREQEAQVLAEAERLVSERLVPIDPIEAEAFLNAIRSGELL